METTFILYHFVKCKAFELCSMQSVRLLGVIGHPEGRGFEWSQVLRDRGDGKRRVLGNSPHQT